MTTRDVHCFLMTTAFVLILSPTEVQQVADLQCEKEVQQVADLQREKEALQREKEALESEKEAIEKEAADLKKTMEE